MLKSIPVTVLVAGSLLTLSGATSTQTLPNLFPFIDPSGFFETFSTNGAIDLSNAFFSPSLGTNGRSCSSCHRPEQGWAVSALGMQALFDLTQGLDPVFNVIDGNCPTADVSTLAARQKAFSLQTQHGLFRYPLPPVGLTLPPGTDFQVVSVQNQYGSACASTTNVSVYRRVIPATNSRFESGVLWDGRSSTSTFFIPGFFVEITPSNYPASLQQDLTGLAFAAAVGAMQSTLPPNAPQFAQAAALGPEFSTAQAIDFQAGFLNFGGATGGPEPISTLPFSIGINDPASAAFNPAIFTLYKAWDNPGFSPAQQSVARGEDVFNNTIINISNVPGMNDVPGAPAVIKAHCGTCHDTPGVGGHSVFEPINLGVANVSGSNFLDTSYLPVITLMNSETGETVQTTDPGRALITGKFADIGKFKVPVLRGLAARAPYFHNGAALSLDDVVNFYNQRFNIGFTPQQHADLVAFLKTL